MFITYSNGGHDRDGGQRRSGRFLIVACADEKKEGERYRELRGIVRYAQMWQSGHYMVGFVTIGDHQVHLSGGFGQNGLPKDQAAMGPVWDQMLPVPEDVAVRYWSSSDGHNTVGSAAPDFKAWAEANFKALTKPIKVKR